MKNNKRTKHQRASRGWHRLALGLLVTAAGGTSAYAAPGIVYLHVDDHFYRADSETDMNLTYLGVGGDYAWVSETAQMANCSHSNPAADSHIMFFFGYTAPPLDISQSSTMSYNTYGGVFDTIGVLTIKTTWGDVVCAGAVATPYQFDHIFTDGLENT